MLYGIIIGEVRELAENLTTVKVPSNIIKVFRDMYEIPTHITHKQVVLYAIACSLPERGRYAFAQDFKLNAQLLDSIIVKRNTITKDSVKNDIDSINAKLDSIAKKNNADTPSMHPDNRKLDIIINLLRILMVENYTLGTDSASLQQYLDSTSSQELLQFAKSYND